MILENDKIKLRAIEPEDLEYIFKWENDTTIWAVSNTLTPFSRYVVKQYIENSHLDIFESKQLRLIIEAKFNGHANKVVGSVDIFDFDPHNQRAGLGILIAETKDRGNGFAKETLKLLMDYCFNTLLLNQLYCNIAEDNKISLNLFKSTGFSICGKKEKWIRSASGYKDEFMLQIINKNQFSDFS